LPAAAGDLDCAAPAAACPTNHKTISGAELRAGPIRATPGHGRTAVRFVGGGGGVLGAWHSDHRHRAVAG
jgi:hypothetical protein